MNKVQYIYIQQQKDASYIKHLFAQQKSPDNTFQLDLQNNDGKTALDLARDTINEAFIDEIQQLLPVRARGSDILLEDNLSSSMPLSTSSNTQYTIPKLSTVSPQTLKNLTCT